MTQEQTEDRTKEAHGTEPPEQRERRLQQAVQALRIADGIRGNPVVMAEIRSWLIEQARVAGMLLNQWQLMDPGPEPQHGAAHIEQVTGPVPAGHEGTDMAAIGRAVLGEMPSGTSKPNDLPGGFKPKRN